MRAAHFRQLTVLFISGDLVEFGKRFSSNRPISSALSVLWGVVNYQKLADIENLVG